MKKIMTLAATVLVTLAAVAQNAQRPLEQMMREFRQTVLNRQPAEMPLQGKLPRVQAAKQADAKMQRGMPNDSFWFPGEWEEVQAIVVTPYYNYISSDPQYQGYYYTADPIVTGYAAVYHYSGGWQYVGMTGYTAEIDVTSSFAQVAFYLMDAIQKGGAEAWVRVESFDDTTTVLQHLASKNLCNDNIRFFEAPGNSFWYRDCGPICFYYGEGDTLGMLDFEYYPGRALDDSLPVYIERQFGLPNFTTQIEWEGGNCLVDGAGMLFTSDAVYGNNADSEGQYTWDGVNISSLSQITKAPLTHAQVKDSLHALVSPRATYILPTFKYDGGTGHVDLYADMVDENLFIFSLMPEAYSNWYDYKVGVKNMDSLCSYQSYFGANYRRRFIPFPSTDNGGNFSSQIVYNNQYTRTYSNHTFVNNLIIQPCFSAVGADGMPTAAWDYANIEQVKAAYPGYTIYCVDVREFDGTGGAIHCITKQIPAEHPIRILHKPIHDNTGNDYIHTNAPIVAEISCVDEIVNAQVVYRIEGSDWRHEDLVPDATGQYAALMHTANQLQGTDTKVEYYITATSATGKTITKPMTASQGGYFTFYLGENPSVAVPEVDNAEAFGQFFPNPATDQAHVRIALGEGRQRYAVSIVDALGRTVHTTTLDAAGDMLFTVNTSRLAAGFYSVLFENEGQRVVRRLVVK